MCTKPIAEEKPKNESSVQSRSRRRNKFCTMPIAEEKPKNESSVRKNKSRVLTHGRYESFAQNWTTQMQNAQMVWNSDAENFPKVRQCRLRRSGEVLHKKHMLDWIVWSCLHETTISHCPKQTRNEFRLRRMREASGGNPLFDFGLEISTFLNTLFFQNGLHQTIDFDFSAH